MDKLIPTWNEKYSIHDTMIDIQHQKLFELAGKVESAVYKFVKREELKENIIRDMSYLIQNIKTTNDLKEKLYTIMSEWLLEHILHHDVMIGNWLSDQILSKQEEELEKINEEILYENTPTTPTAKQVKHKEYEFIYSCPCRTNHILSYTEHLDILCHKKQLRCKKCQKNLFYVKSELKD
ncbi:hemerythrin family non-heme iron protein [Campylobacter jejuni]|uniref:hemerythrin family non-heme iron protein n=1 Tax=Campylobacter jejuni TaxID=197 RepID=UPI0022098DA9|nr:hemerythrin family non-heme iron protein [Campylobacter jejuni]